MKTIYKLAIGVGALSALAGAAQAQATATASAAGSATIIQPITAAKNTDLSFGTIVKPTAGTATVAVDASGGRTVTGTAATNGGTVNAANFTVSGEGASVFSLTMPSTFTMTNTGGDSLVVSTVNGLGATGTLSGSLGGGGSVTFGVGGSFNLTTATNSGAYTGNFTITTAYN